MTMKGNCFVLFKKSVAKLILSFPRYDLQCLMERLEQVWTGSLTLIPAHYRLWLKNPSPKKMKPPPPIAFILFTNIYNFLIFPNSIACVAS